MSGRGKRTERAKIEPDARGEFEVRTTGAKFRLGLYRTGATLRRIPGPDSQRSPYDWRSTIFFGTLDPIRMGERPVFVLSTRETWAGSAVTSIRLLRNPCRECGGPDVFRRGRCWRCVVAPDHASAAFRDHSYPGERRWRNRMVRIVDRWLCVVSDRVAVNRLSRHAAKCGR